MAVSGAVPTKTKTKAIAFDDKQGEELREAATAGDVPKVENILCSLSTHPISKIDIFACFILASISGNLEIMKLSHEKCEDNSHLVSGLLKATRFGRYKAAKWILSRSEFTISNVQIMDAVRHASLNQHWGIMKLLLIKAGLYIEGPYQYPTFLGPKEQDLLLLRSMQSLKLCEEVDVPKNSFIPYAVRGRQNLEKKMSKSEREKPLFKPFA